MKLIAFDLEGTLADIRAYSGGKHESPSIWPIIADEIKATEEENRVNKMWKEGKFETYIDYMEATIVVHKDYGLTEEIFKGIIDKIPWINGIEETFDELRRSDYKIMIVSGGFRNHAERIPSKPDYIFAGCDYIFKEGKLDSWELIESDWQGKIECMDRIIGKLSIIREDCCFVGDGKNDVKIAQYCGNSIAINACEELKKAAKYSIDTKDLRDILGFIE
ncbi:MAG: HAD family hydrolase [Candidatus Woesearchaeota archaeon]